jgi:hypothetical protein
MVVNQRPGIQTENVIMNEAQAGERNHGKEKKRRQSADVDAWRTPEILNGAETRVEPDGCEGC